MNFKYPPSRPAERWPLPWLRTLGFRYLMVADALVILSSTALITSLRFGTGWPSYSIAYHLIGFGLATLIHLVVYYFGGLYEYEQRLGRASWLPRVSALSLFSFLIIAFFGLFTSRFLMPRASLVLLFFIASLGVTFNRWLSCSVRSKRFGNPKILLIGTEADISLATKHLLRSKDHVEIVGSTTPTKELSNEIDSSGATDILLLGENDLAQIYPNPLEELEQRRIGIYKRVTPSDTLLGLRRSRQIAGMPFISLEVHAVPTHTLRLKRMLDLVYIFLISPLILMVFSSLVLYVRIRVGKGVFYRQRRIGCSGHQFLIWKFRTMPMNAETESGAKLAVAGDPRVIKGMGWLRRARLDELPQLWNVFKGEMSLVGPRPERPEFAEKFQSRIPGYKRRHDIPPGLTGLAQVQGDYETDPAYKLGHDLQYIVNWSPILDIQIGLKTVLVVLRQSAQ